MFQNDLMQLSQYHPRTPDQHSVPIRFVPAWINKCYILDMQPKNSLVLYMLDRGHSVFVISWVNPTSDHADKYFADYMTLGPLAALDAIRDITGEEKANILGFCIGGILVTATLAYLAGIGDDRVNSATTLATMVDFKDVGEMLCGRRCRYGDRGCAKAEVNGWWERTPHASTRPASLTGLSWTRSRRSIWRCTSNFRYMYQASGIAKRLLRQYSNL